MYDDILNKQYNLSYSFMRVDDDKKDDKYYIC